MDMNNNKFEFNAITFYLTFGLIVAWVRLLGFDWLGSFVSFLYIGLAMMLVIMSPFVFLPMLYNARRVGALNNFFNQISEEKVKRAKAAEFFTYNIYGLIFLCFYFFGIHECSLCMATLSILILWRMVYFMISDILSEHLHLRGSRKEAEEKVLEKKQI